MSADKDCPKCEGWGAQQGQRLCECQDPAVLRARVAELEARSKSDNEVSREINERETRRAEKAEARVAELEGPGGSNKIRAARGCVWCYSTSKEIDALRIENARLIVVLREALDVCDGEGIGPDPARSDHLCTPDKVTAARKLLEGSE